jgi:hypothetical protein
MLKIGTQHGDGGTHFDPIIASVSVATPDRVVRSAERVIGRHGTGHPDQDSPQYTVIYLYGTTYETSTDTGQNTLIAVCYSLVL